MNARGSNRKKYQRIIGWKTQLSLKVAEAEERNYTEKEKN